MSKEGYWYLGTPYSKYPAGLANAYVDACRAAAHFIKQGRAVFCPIAHTHPIADFGNMDKLDHTIWIPMDEPFMRFATGLIVVMMPGWDDSYGLKIEIAAFKEMHKPIQYAGWPL